MKAVVIALAVVGAICLAPVLLLVLGVFFLPICVTAVMVVPILAAYLIGKSKRKEDSKEE